MKRSSAFQLQPVAWAVTALATIAALGLLPLNGAQAEGSDTKTTAAEAAPAASAASSAAPAKDVVLDRPDGPVTAPLPAGMVPTPTAGNAPSAAPAAGPTRRPGSGMHDAFSSGALAELALNLMQQQSAASGDAQVNAVVSPVSLASALGMVHAGTSGAAARELAALMAPQSLGNRFFTARLPSILDRLAPPKGASRPFAMANRVWLDPSVVAAVPPTYAAMVQDRYNADAALVSFSQAAAARQAINGWVSDKTAKRIPELMPEGSITPTTRLVVTNAIHFKSKWEQPFDPGQTVAKPFQLTPGSSKSVPTMVDERQVRTGTVDNVTVIELPFAGSEYSLILGMPPSGHTLNAFETDLDGTDLASWSGRLKSTTCRLELPKFIIAPANRPLKPALEALGVKSVFSPEADFAPMFGKAGKGVYLDNVFQSATILIDELGGEAAAATGGAMQSKSFSMPAPACAVNRPFIFAVLHKATGVPLFVGKVADPSKP